MASIKGQQALAPNARAPLPRMLDELAKSNPRRIFASIAQSSDATSFLDVTYRQFANAVNKVAELLERKLGRSSSFTTIAYIGPADIRYFILLIGAIKVGQTCTLLEQLGCNILAVPDGPIPPAVRKVLQERSAMHKVTIPNTQELLSDELNTKEFHYNKSFDEFRHEPCVVLHSSGTTGLPKLVTLRHGIYTNMDTFQSVPRRGNGSTWHTELQNSRVFISMPPFHAAGLFMGLVPALYWGTTIVYGPSAPINVEIIDAIHECGSVDGTLLPSSLLVEIVNSPPSFDKLARLRFVGFAGSPLPQSTGDTLCQRIMTFSMYGSTEVGSFPMHNTEPSEWQYLAFNAEATGLDFRPVGGGLSEMVIVREQGLDPDQGVFNNFPELNEWATNDLYLQDPQRSELWLYHGRKDDVIVLRNGEKFNPNTMESIIESHPQVSAAVIVGQDRHQSALLIEPDDSVEIQSIGDCRHFVGNIWPVIDKANQSSVGPACVSKDLVLVVQNGKHFARTAKGSIRKQEVLKEFKDSIDALYFASETVNGATPTVPSFSGVENARQSIRTLVNELGYEIADFDTNLFWAGLDSVGVLAIVRAINGASKSSRLKARDVYEAGTISGLVAFVMQPDSMKSDRRPDYVREMESLYQKYSADAFKRLYRISETLHRLSLSRTAAEHERLPKEGTVLLTGSTGSLGTYLLDVLIHNKDVKKIYCLNRSSDAAVRHRDNALKLDMKVAEPSSVIFLQGDLQNERFGLPRATYSELVNSVTSVIHNAWTVDFNLPLQAFEQHLQGVNELILFYARSSHCCNLYFLSTVSVAMGVDTQAVSTTVSEDVIDNWNKAEPIGYAQSKLVAERLLDRFANALNADFTICRVGQIAGPVKYTKGKWAPKEWLPSLIRSSDFLSFVPESLGPLDQIDWIPVDMLAEAIVEMLLSSSKHGRAPPQDGEHTPGQHASVHHAVNPQTINWASLLPTVQMHIYGNVRPVPLDAWVDCLANSSSADPKANPASKLTEFFQSLTRQDRKAVVFDTKKAQLASPTLANSGSVTPAWMDLWMTQWDF
ncbi:MAG: putative NRPS-like protein biosynthetic cluster [Bogoriella megaspora]|nr:MAG: putative NRPS-like protein biosynthetic cluster [Bogoriella megaspora]